MGSCGCYAGQNLILQIDDAMIGFHELDVYVLVAARCEALYRGRRAPNYAKDSHESDRHAPEDHISPYKLHLRCFSRLLHVVHTGNVLT